MLFVQKFEKLGRYALISSVLSSVFISPSPVLAQGALEEIVVSAQRRDQSIQEVPVSLEAFSGNILNQQGFRTMEDLSNFSPSVEIDVRFQDQDVSIRGLGTSGNNLALEQAAPIFVDGVHFGRTSMVMGAFLDLERLEVLRGPQPIAFGQNATAGAFSLITKKPGTEWQGDVTAEYGNWGRASLEGGVGGPISDTLGIRVAGQYDQLNGYIRDVVTGDMFPRSRENAGRMTLVWNPTENFEATLKGEVAIRRKGGDGMAVCRSKGEVPLSERAVTIPGLTVFDQIHDVMPYPDDCENGFERVGNREGSPPFFHPIPGIDQEDDGAGIVDFVDIAENLMDNNAAHDDMNSYNYRLGLNYQFANGINLDSNTAVIDYQRNGVYDNSSSPIPTNFQHRGEIFDMHSQEFRFLSPRGGRFEWEAGLYYQQEDLDLGNMGDPKYGTITIRAGTRHPIRAGNAWQDTVWKSAFATFTFNFMDDKASVDVGARYTDIEKTSFGHWFGAMYIFDINPFTNDFDGNDARATATQHTNNNLVKNVSASMIDCATGHPNCGTYGAGFWTSTWEPPGSRRGVPDAWDTRAPVDIGPLLSSIRAPFEPFVRDYDDNSLDPQVTLRYRPSEDLSFYGKWARAFKGGGADLAFPGSPPANLDDFFLAAEHSENFEVGAKGSLLDGAANYNVSIFTITVTDLQMPTATPVQLDTAGSSNTVNAGKQRTRGIEFDSRWAATDQLTLGISGAIMDGVMVEFTGAGCTDAEFAVGDTGPCLTAEESEELYGTDEFEGTIDRTGSKAPRTPDWKFIFDVDWWTPVSERHKFMFSTKLSYIDGYIFVIEDFDEILKYDTRFIANLNAGIGDIDDTWNVSLWVRNLTEAGMKYFPEFDVAPVGRVDNNLGSRNWRSYGVQFQYNYN